MGNKKIKRLGLVAIALLSIQIPKIVYGLEIETNDGETFEIGETLYESPLDEFNDGELKYEEIEPTMGEVQPAIIPKVIIGNNDLIKVSNTQHYPYSTSAYVQSSGFGHSYRGSANFIEDNILITAAHNVYDKSNKMFFENILVIPAVSPDKQPYGSFKVEKVYMLKAYKSSDVKISSRNDLALLVLKEPVGAKVGTLGLYNKTKNYKGSAAMITGYPAVESGVKQMYTDGKQILNDDGFCLDYKIDTMPGSSGSAVYDRYNKVIGVHVRGSNVNQQNTAIKLNNSNLSFIYSTINKNQLSGWEKINNEWFYYKDSTKYTGWLKLGDIWYYLNNSGVMQTGWLKLGDTWYYLNSSGAMQTGWLKLGDTWYYLNSSGAMQTGWLKLGDTWYYLNSSGAMQTGWLKLGATWYYLNSSGAMLVGTHTIDGKVYRFSSTGALL